MPAARRHNRTATPERAALPFVLAVAAACGGGPPTSVPEGFDPRPRAPAARTDAPSLAELGRHLFYDRRLSVNGSRACGTCHEQKKAFTDGFPRAIGATLEVHPRNSPTLANVGQRDSLGWHDPRPASLEWQMLRPLFGTAPVEMGMAGMEATLTARLTNDAHYRALVAAAFPGVPNLSLPNVTQAIAAFERTLKSDDAPFDRHLRGQAGALSALAQAGMRIFLSPRAGCGLCHNGPDLDRPPEGGAAFANFANVGLYDLDGRGGYPDGNRGLIEITGKPEDMGRFRTPPLRNVAITAPYFHDGSVPTLAAVIAIHLAGGRNVVEGPRQGDGRKSPLRDVRLSPRMLSADEIWAIEAFLHALTDDAFLTNPALADPWPALAEN